jgi:superfamily II DNA or RNA helicase
MNLYDHQVKFLEKNPDKAMLVWGMGSGKTRGAIEWAKKRGNTLIVVPKGLKENWRRECEMWGLQDYTILSKEEFKKVCRDYNQGTVIVDEADHFFAPLFKSQLSKSLRWYMKNKNPNILLLTGTPYRSSAWNIFTAASFLGHEWNYMAFKNDFFIDIRMGYRTIPKPRAGSEEKLRNLIGAIGEVFNPEDGFDIPAQIDETIHLKETRSQEIAHRDNQEISYITRFTRDHQIEAYIGVEKGDDVKLERIREYALDVPKIAVVCRYRAQLDTYAKAMRKDGYTVYEIHGDIQNRSEVLDEVENSERCILMLQSATCEGYEAPSIGLMVFASMDYSYRNYTQMKGRIHRMNRLKKNVYVHLLAGTCDKAIMKCMSNKSDFDVLKFYARENNNGQDTESDEGGQTF